MTYIDYDEINEGQYRGELVPDELIYSDGIRREYHPDFHGFEELDYPNSQYEQEQQSYSMLRPKEFDLD